MKRPRVRHTTVPRTLPPRPQRPSVPRRSSRAARSAGRVQARRKTARIVRSEASLLDVLDSLLNKGVVLNADIVLGLANVDLVYLRLSALLCAADRILKR